MAVSKFRVSFDPETLLDVGLSTVPPLALRLQVLLSGPSVPRASLKVSSSWVLAVKRLDTRLGATASTVATLRSNAATALSAQSLRLGPLLGGV